MRGGCTLTVFCAFALSACALKDLPPHDDTVRHAMPNLAVPASWAAGEATATVADNWLASLHEPRLDDLVHEALAYNTDLRTAAARVDLAVAYLSAAKSPLWPQVN